MRKKELRRKMKHKLSRISFFEIRESSRKIKENLEKLSEFKEAKTIFIYLSFNNEVDTYSLIKKLLRTRKKKISVPKIEGKNLKPYQINSLDQLRKGKYGVPSPPTDKYVEKIDLVIVPGIAFDCLKNRLGRGKGYYDRFLSSNPVCSVGLAYEKQVMKLVPHGPSDKPVDILVTDMRVLR